MNHSVPSLQNLILTYAPVIVLVVRPFIVPAVEVILIVLPPIVVSVRILKTLFVEKDATPKALGNTTPAVLPPPLQLNFNKL